MDQATQLRRMVAGDEGEGDREFIADVVTPTVVLDVPPSVLRGQVSFGPARRTSTSAANVAAATATVQRGSVPVLHPHRLATAIAVTSGKGGVGKSNIAVNLSIVLAALGRRVALIDADLGMANADLLCNITPRFTLADVVSGRCRLGDALIEAPGGFRLLPGAAGVARIARLGDEALERLVRRLSVLEAAMDSLVIDTGAGIHPGVLSHCAAAETVLLTTTPEPTAMTDAYGLVKALVRRHTTESEKSISPDPRRPIELSPKGPRIWVVMNMARTEGEARDAFNRLDRVSRTFLDRRLVYAGMIPDDATVRQAVHQRVPFTLLAPKCRASRAMVEMGSRIAGELHSIRCAGGGVEESGEARMQGGFVERLRRLIVRGRAS